MVKTHEFRITAVETPGSKNFDSELYIEGDPASIMDAIIRGMERQPDIANLILGAAIGYSLLNKMDLIEFYLTQQKKYNGNRKI